MKPELLRGLLERAVEQELGLVVECTNPAKLQHALDIFDPGHKLYPVINAIPDIPNHLFICRPGVDLQEDIFNVPR